MDRMTFRRFSGIYQLEIADARDLGRIEFLDVARWAATSAPVGDLQCDPAFLAFMDAGAKGRIRTREVLAARDWLFRHLAIRDRLHEKTETLLLADLDASHPEGQRIRQTAEHVLKEANVTPKDRVTLAQVRTFQGTYRQALENGDGIVCPENVVEPEVAAFIRGIARCVGSGKDASGRDGAGTEQLDRFLERAQVYLEWKAKDLPPDGRADLKVFPWGAGTASAAALVKELDPKLDLFFRQCDLVQQDPKAAARLSWTEEELKKLAVGDAAAIGAALDAAPFAPAQPSGRLPLTAPVNPAYQARFERLKATVLPRVLGAGVAELTRRDWAEVKAAFEDHWAWLAAQPAEPFDAVGLAQVQAWVKGPLPERLRQYIQLDLAAKTMVDEVSNLEKLILYQRWLLEFTNNFVNFSALYHPQLTALFETGTLIVDGRRLELSVRVTNRAEHKKVAAESHMFLVYAAIWEKAGGPPAFEVAAPVTSGERGRLVIGKRGVFHGVDGREWDATIVDLVENPISLWEAVKAPFVRGWSFVSSKIEGMAASKVAESEKDMLARADPLAHLPKPPAAAPPAPGAPAAPASSSGTRDLLLGGGLAIAALGSAMAYIVSALSQVNFWNALAVVASVVAVVAGLSGLLGWLKLRRRELGPLLEANGWAVNHHMRLRSRLGHFFTRIPRLPQDAVRVRGDFLQDYATDDEGEDLVKWWRLALLGLLGVALLYAFMRDVYPGLPPWIGGRGFF